MGAPSPRVSVIIPTYNYGAHLSAAVESALHGAFRDLEVVIVDDGSTDNTRQVAEQLTSADHRVLYLYQNNRGLPAARNAGIRASCGEILAFLDADDRFHPEKLHLQVAFLDAHPDVGLAYNHRILVDSSGEPFYLQRASRQAGLVELLEGYPFTPSDVVMRREWVERVGLFDESFRLNSEDLNFHLRLALQGCRMAGVDRALTYRQVHTGRKFKDIAGKMQTYLRALDTAFWHPDCPPDALYLRDRAYARHYRFWGVQALLQEEPELGRELLRQAQRLDPTLAGDREQFLRQVLWHTLREGGEHEPALRRALESLPDELAPAGGQAEQAVSRGYLERGVRDRIWGRPEAAEENFRRARETGAQLDQPFLEEVASQLASFEAEFGQEQASQAFIALARQIEVLASPTQARLWSSAYRLNRAFRDYRRGAYRRVPGSILRAAIDDPLRLANRGVLSIFARSLIGSRGRS